MESKSIDRGLNILIINSMRDKNKLTARQLDKRLARFEAQQKIANETKLAESLEKELAKLFSPK